MNGFFRGTTRGAVVGSHVGKELAKFFITATPEVTQACLRQGQGVGCAYFMLVTPMFGLFALVGMPPLLTTGGSIYGAFTAYTAPEVEEWENTLTTVHKQVQIQTTFRDYVVRSLVSCCPGLLIGNAPSTVGPAEASNLQGVDTILRVEVLELGLAEASSNEMLEPDENFRPITLNPLVAAFAPVGAAFQKSRSSLYVLVWTSLLRANDGNLIDQRQFGYLSSPRPYMEWSENNGSRFRTELLAAYQSLGDQIVEKLINSTHRANETDEAR